MRIADATLSQLPQSDYVYLPCSASPAQLVTYDLGYLQYTPGVRVEQQPLVQIGKMDPVMGLVETDALMNGAQDAYVRELMAAPRRQAERLRALERR